MQFQQECLRRGGTHVEIVDAVAAVPLTESVRLFVRDWAVLAYQPMTGKVWESRFASTLSPTRRLSILELGKRSGCLLAGNTNPNKTFVDLASISYVRHISLYSFQRGQNLKNRIDSWANLQILQLGCRLLSRFWHHAQSRPSIPCSIYLACVSYRHFLSSQGCNLESCSASRANLHHIPACTLAHTHARWNTGRWRRIFGTNARYMQGYSCGLVLRRTPRLYHVQHKLISHSSYSTKMCTRHGDQHVEKSHEWVTLSSRMRRFRCQFAVWRKAWIKDACALCEFVLTSLQSQQSWKFYFDKFAIPAISCYFDKFVWYGD